MVVFESRDEHVLQSSASALTSITSPPHRTSAASPPSKVPGTEVLWPPSCMPLGLLPLGKGGAEDRLRIGGFVWFGTGSGRAPAGVIAACISVGANWWGEMREGEVRR